MLFFSLLVLLKATFHNSEFLSSDIGSVEGEAGVLIQAIMSIRSIIKQDPPSHEKVSLLFCGQDGVICFYHSLFHSI